MRSVQRMRRGTVSSSSANSAAAMLPEVTRVWQTVPLGNGRELNLIALRQARVVRELTRRVGMV